MLWFPTMEMLFATLLLPLGLLLALMITSMRYVPEDTVLTVHRFGRYEGVRNFV